MRLYVSFSVRKAEEFLRGQEKRTKSYARMWYGAPVSMIDFSDILERYE